MPNPKQVVLGFASEGMNGSLSPALIGERAFASATNVMIDGQLPTTRLGCRQVPLTGDDAEAFKSENFQGAVFYNPAKGQSGQTFSEESASIVLSAGGRKFQIVPSTSTNPRKSTATVDDVTGDENLRTSRDFHLVHLFQAENYVIGSDGNSDTWIWDGQGEARFSNGFDTTNKEDSELPNGAFLGVYAHGRIVQCVDGRQLSVGDIIHKQNLTSPENILQTTEQVYWATGLGFRPPTQMGKILGIFLLPIMDTAHGHGEIMAHCEDGIFSLDINIYPRSSWPEQKMTKIVLMDTGARGPYAAALYDGDQIFRSRHGLQTLRSVSAQKQALGNPYHPISEAVDRWLLRDHQQWVRFASVGKWAVSRRLFCTTCMFVDGANRGGRGLVSLNFAPIETQRTQSAWEGLWTMPPAFDRILQLVNGNFSGRDRMFSINWSKGHGNSLVEFDESLKADVMADGTESRISCQLITRAVDMGDRQAFKDIMRGVLSLRRVSGELDWGVWFRSVEDGEWLRWRTGSLTVRDRCCPITKDNPDFRGFEAKDFDLKLGDLPGGDKRSRNIQFLIRWRGRASVESLTVRFTKSDDSDGDDEPKTEIADRRSCAYNDLEYSTSENRWESQCH